MDSPPPTMATTTTPTPTTTNGHYYPFGPAAKVAVIGAGISGVCTAAHLLRQGLSVTVFERSGIEGGVWHYDDRVSRDPRYPNQTPSRGDYDISLPGQFSYGTPPPEPPVSQDDEDGNGKAEKKEEEGAEEAEEADDALAIAFSPPGPCYVGLTNNVPTTLMVSSLEPWPAGTEPNVTQAEIEHYVQTLSRRHGVRAATLFRTRVDDLRKRGGKWLVRSVTLEEEPSGEGEGGGKPARLVEKIWEFDLVVVATGHYNMPRVPDIPGLRDWKAAFPGRVTHSKQYRRPDAFRAQNVLVIGAGVSSLDICRELHDVAARTFQSARGGVFDLAASLLPANGERVAEITSFVLPRSEDSGNREENANHLAPDQPIPGTVHLKDGTTLSGIHRVVVATGYVTSYPFLRQLHSDTAGPAEADATVLVTADGDMTHNLHKDVFYIPDPSLAFVGVPYHTATFSLFDFQAQAVALVFAGRTALPDREAMRREYGERLRARGGVGRTFHSLRVEGMEIAYVRDLVEWVNRSKLRLNGHGEEGGGGDGQDGEIMTAHPEAWVKEYWALKERLKGRFERDQTRAGAVVSTVG